MIDLINRIFWSKTQCFRLPIVLMLISLTVSTVLLGFIPNLLYQTVRYIIDIGYMVFGAL